MKKRIFPWLFLVLFVVILMLCEHFIFRTNIAKGWFWIVIGVFFLLVNGFNYFCRKLDLYLAIFLGLIYLLPLHRPLFQVEAAHAARCNPELCAVLRAASIRSRASLQ